MKRRSFLQLLGLAPAAVVAPKIAEASEKFTDTAKKLDFGAPPVERSRYEFDDDDCISACVPAVDPQGYRRYLR